VLFSVLLRRFRILMILCSGGIFMISSNLHANEYQLAVSNERSNEVLLLSSDGKVLRQLHTCQRPKGIVTDPLNKHLWIACSDDNRVVRIDPSTGELKQQIAGFKGATGLALFEDDKLLISNEGSASVSVVNRQSGEFLASLKTGYEPDGIVWSSNQQRIFVASENAGLVHVFSASNLQQETVLLTNLRPRRMSVVADELWVSSEMGSRVEIFSMTSLKKIDEIVFSPKGFRSEQLTPVDILFSKNGQQAYVALGAANHVALIDTRARAIEKYILVGRRAWGLALSPDEERLFVLNGLSDDMTIIDLESRRPIASVRTGLVPHAVEVINK